VRTDTIESTGNKKRGRKKKLSRETQHSVWVDPDLWEAADDLPIPRPDIIRTALLDAVAFYKTDLPKLKWELEKVREEKQSILSKEAVLIARIEQLEAKAVIEVEARHKAEESTELAVQETLTMCKAFKKKMGYIHFTKLEELSGVDAAKIEAFLKDTKFRPEEEAIRVFYNR
jgi:hypothetical protein